MALALRQHQLRVLFKQTTYGLTKALFPTTEALETPCKASLATRSNPFEDKERGEENIRFRKEDERLLRQLLNKVKKQADAVDVHEAANSQSVELVALKEILGKYNVSDQDLQKVLEWKHS